MTAPFAGFGDGELPELLAATLIGTPDDDGGRRGGSGGSAFAASGLGGASGGSGGGGSGGGAGRRWESPSTIDMLSGSSVERMRAYKPKLMSGAEARSALAAVAAARSGPLAETLTGKCVRAIASNFAQLAPRLHHVPERFLPDIYRRLPLDLDVRLGSAFVPDEGYWKRRCIDGQGWRNCRIEAHGYSWKQLFFERYLESQLEAFDADSGSMEELRSLVACAEDYVYSLSLKQLLSHIELGLLFNNLPNLTRLQLTYGVRQVGMSYERSMFGMKISDATSLSQCVKLTDTLTMLLLSCNLLDDDLLRMLMTGLIKNSTITYLDVSHNKITNQGARLLAKLLGAKSVLTSLNLYDNQIHAEGGRYLGRALRHNSSLMELNLRLNRLGDEGGRMLLEDLRSNSTLTELNLSSNSLAHESSRALASLMRNPLCALHSLDLSCNELKEEEARILSDALPSQPSLICLDVRRNQIPAESEFLAELHATVRRHELDGRHAAAAT
eukprot:PLAT10026.1.p1 GENE.PLAT10026.1~~PLAT10026.1.p1  ORF type:complete len:511 (+),score=268.67 PLAT10026.1:38-1534(+)